MYEYSIYNLKRRDGSHIRRASRVKDLATGETVRFTDMLGKRRAYFQAYEIFRKGEIDKMFMKIFIFGIGLFYGWIIREFVLLLQKM